MKKNDWLPGFVVGLVLVIAEVSYIVHVTGANRTISSWVQQKTLITLSIKQGN